MKIAIFHQFMDNIGGAEMVVLTLARGLNADIYTTNISLEKITEMGFADVVSRIYSIGRVPINAPFRQQLSFYKFWRLDVEKKFGKKYDHYIIAGDWAMSGAVHNKPNLWYIHSPLNEIWQFTEYVRNELLSFWKRPLYDVWVWFNQKLTLSYAKHVGVWVANSQNTQTRIQKYYHHDSVVIYPSVREQKDPNLTAQEITQKAGGYWLSVNRLVTHKRINIQMKAFAALPYERLILVGSFEKGSKHFELYKKYIESLKPVNVEIIHWASQETLDKLYAECKGFITTAHDEDFGLTPIEAMAYGKPVIATNEGGYKETVLDGKTGILIDDITPEKLAEAVEKVDQQLTRNPLFYKDACKHQAENFSIDVFVSAVRDQIK